MGCVARYRRLSMPRTLLMMRSDSTKGLLPGTQVGLPLRLPVRRAALRATIGYYPRAGIPTVLSTTPRRRVLPQAPRAGPRANRGPAARERARTMLLGLLASGSCRRRCAVPAVHFLPGEDHLRRVEVVDVRE